VHDLGGEVVANVQEAHRLNVEPGLLFHLAYQRLSKGLAVLQLATGQRP
jgi:hypothetical protein